MTSTKKIKLFFTAGLALIGIVIIAGIVDVARDRQKSAREAAERIASVPPEIREKLLQQIANAEAEIEKHPGVVVPYINIGAAHKILGDLDAAEKSLIRATQIAPSNHLALGNLANVYRELGKNREADVAYARALHFAPREEQNYLQYADFLQYRYPDRHEDIVALFERGLETLEGAVNIRRAYARYLADHGDLLESLEQWRALKADEPENSAIDEEIREIEQALR